MASSHEDIIREILISRGYDTTEKRQAFIDPTYEAYRHDPFLLPDMSAAVDRIVAAHDKKQNVVIYGDYDIDGLTATTLLLDALESFGLNVSAFIPNRFVEGYGLSSAAITTIVEQGADLIVTVDCGSLSFDEIAHANKLGVDVIVTDHHSVAETMPDAIAVINPKRLVSSGPENVPQSSSDNSLRGTSSARGAGLTPGEANTPSLSLSISPSSVYPFTDLAGVGVAFKLVQALQTRLEGLPKGQEKWLLDLVALGTVCDVVSLTDENRANGRLETAQLSLDLLRSVDPSEALAIAERLEMMNLERRGEQQRIFVAASEIASDMSNDPVLVVIDPSWSHGIIGIVAANLLEKYHKPTFVLQELPDGTSKGSARSFGDFSAVAGIRATDNHLIKGGGHKLAAGVTLETKNIDQWRRAINTYYQTLNLRDQLQYLLPNADITLEGFGEFTDHLVREITRLEPYGNGNPSPIFKVAPVEVIGRRTMGDNAQHVKFTLTDAHNKTFQVIAFNKADEFDAVIGDSVAVWVELTINEWQGRRTVEGRLLRMERA